MLSFDVSSYRDQFLTYANQSIGTVQTNISLFTQSTLTEEQKQLKNEVFRMIHTLKSQSAFMGYAETANLCLIMEKILKQLLNTNFTLTSLQYSVLNEGIVLLTQDIANIKQFNKEVEVKVIIAKLTNLFTEVTK
jgi:two-component system, chemotaxis family, sensor kinase CheA